MAEQGAGDAADDLRDFDLNEPIDSSKGLRSGLTRYIYLLTVFRAPSMTPELTRPTAASCCQLWRYALLPLLTESIHQSRGIWRGRVSKAAHWHHQHRIGFQSMPCKRASAD